MQTQTEQTKREDVTASLLQEYDDKMSVSGNHKPLKRSADPAAALTANRAYRGTWNRRQNIVSSKQVRCYSCNQMGHFARNFPNKKYANGQHRGEGEQTAQANHSTMLMASAVAEDGDKLLLDSGASDHMVANCEYLMNTVNIPPKDIVLGNGERVTAHQEGHVLVETFITSGQGNVNSKRMSLKDVLHVPSLRTNLVSVSSLCGDGADYSFHFGKGKFDYLRNGILQFEGTNRRGVYVMNAKIIVPRTAMALAAAIRPMERLWHIRLGHAHTDGIRELSRKGVVVGLDLEKPPKVVQNCDACIAGKQHKLSMKYNPHRASRIGEVIHSDVCGPMSVPSLGGSRYFVTFIDEFSGYITAVPIAKRSEVGKRFMNYSVWLERRYDCSNDCTVMEQGSTLL